MPLQVPFSPGLCQTYPSFPPLGFADMRSTAFWSYQPEFPAPYAQQSALLRATDALCDGSMQPLPSWKVCRSVAAVSTARVPPKIDTHQIVDKGASSVPSPGLSAAAAEVMIDGQKSNLGPNSPLGRPSWPKRPAFTRFAGMRSAKSVNSVATTSHCLAIQPR